jgi:ribosomal protein L3 glutamine methyltransferase
MQDNIIKLDETTELDTIKDFIRFGVSIMEQSTIFYGHGTDNSFDEMIYLIYGYLNLPFDKLEFYLDTKLTKKEKIAICELLNKRIYQNIPTAYLINKAYLNNFEFYIDTRSIIPRSFIANIILNDQLLPYIEHRELVTNVLDLCTGNSSLAIIAAHYFYDSNVVASDISQDALDIAQINIDNYNLNHVITPIKSNLFDELDQYQNTFDVIISNPPYVDNHRMEKLPAEYLYEPQLSLAGGTNGIELVEKILVQASYYLNDFGILIIEMGDNKEELEDKYPELELKWFDTENNEGFIFLVTKEVLVEYFNNEQ